MKRWGVFLLGLGIGGWLGVQVGEAAALGGLVVAVAGLLLLGLGARSGDPGGDLVGDAMEARADGGEATAPADRPKLPGLGRRVEQILRLSEEQAAAHLAQAKVEADRILADARAEADRIRSDGSPPE
ncbi:hypothetical protein ODJ79_20285 [Actinoplanes sp. KI2]|uniref:hypothetical protein n=1 Tax=Actinoplanes sp. KI2 TaxID=2983315 RepID=UPI0021D5D506|nr:hypothetical protein [Actinoplanes sp. KI2]MCU7726070.1 hypothetical protein [Actinoplanes sp. KI2]